MNLQISDKAAQWYKEEMEVKNGTQIGFFARYGGCSNIQSGFSLGVAVQDAINPGITTESNGLIFYIEEKDLWYFEGKDVFIDLDEKTDEPVFNYN